MLSCSVFSICFKVFFFFLMFCIANLYLSLYFFFFSFFLFYSFLSFFLGNNIFSLVFTVFLFLFNVLYIWSLSLSLSSLSFLFFFFLILLFSPRFCIFFSSPLSYRRNYLGKESRFYKGYYKFNELKSAAKMKD
jgi:hypothetical protein